MAIDIFATGFLIRLVTALPQPRTHFLSRYFPYVEEQGGEFILIDRLKNRPRLAPFVSPLVEGKVVENLGYNTEAVRPAYIKDKRRFNPFDKVRRLAGETIGGSLTPEQRRRALVRQNVADQLQMLTNREEWMASQVLRFGKVTVTGEGFGTRLVDFRRDPQLTIQLTGAKRWDQGTATPLEDLEEWAQLVYDVSGAQQLEVTMDPSAWRLLKARLTTDEKKILLDSLRGSRSEVEMGPRQAATSKYVGTIGEFDFFVYKQTFFEVDGSEAELMDAGRVVMCGAQVEGTRAYGGIYDEEAESFMGLRYFNKSWVTPDPSARWMLMQSSPLVVPMRPDATVSIKVTGPV
ncbi:MAG: major capsid protein [Gemmatimonadota bacterium]